MTHIGTITLESERLILRRFTIVYLSRGDVFYLAIDESDRVVGMVGTETVSPTELWLKRLFIKPELKGKGIGGKLLSTVEKYAASKGITTLRTKFADWYSEAARFYPAKGFIDAGSEDYLRYMVKYFYSCNQSHIRDTI
ncbi:MAG: GNAT family N-acetyltransferase [Oscillospiraceae bacterium]|jgi:GNAT superfamily N-acetyltransferase|nr:GNAT family N-acetyltransferase [Oscillospiraceae bacterium]